MSPEVWFVAIFGPIAGGVVAIIAARLTRRTGQEQVQVQASAVKVDEKEAHTHEISVMIEGFQASVVAATAQLKVARDDAALDRAAMQEARAELQVARTENEQLRKDHAGLRGIVGEMLSHIISLEKLIPTPPGPPARPNWNPHGDLNQRKERP